MSEEQKPSEDKSLEVRKYQESLAKEYGLPSPFQTGLLKQMAADMVESGLLPECFRGKPMAAYLAMARGRELDISPIESVMETFWPSPGGRLGMFSNKCLDILHRRGVKSKFIKEEADGCEILFIPPTDHEPYSAKFDIAEAITAGLMKDGSNWKKWPKDMCRSRAIGRGWKAMAGVAGKGVNLMTPEEIQEIEFETVASATSDSPEVQAPPEKPATAGRRAKADKPIDVKPEPAQTEPTPTPAPEQPKEQPKAAEPAPAATKPAFQPRYFVIPSNASLPALDKMESGPIEKLGIAAKITTDLPEAMKVSDSLTRDNTAGITHYVLTFKEDGKASILHTSKATPAPKKEAPKPTPAQTATVDPTPRMYVVLAETVAKTVTTIAELESLSSSPHPDISTMGIMAQAEANKYGVPYLVMYKKDGQYHLAEKFNPPTGSQSTATPSTEAPTPEDQAMRERLTSKLKELKANVPTTVKFADRPGIIYAYVTAYMGIADIKEFRSHLDLGEQALIACEKDLLANPVEFVSNAVEWGKRARAAVAVPATTPQMNNGEIAAMAKYYQERGWNGPVTSLAEQYRRSVKPDPVEFQKMLEFSGVKILPSKDAEAFFLVMLTYDKETNKKFAMGMDGTEYGATLTKIRDRFDGADLKDIPAVKFADALEQILSGTEPEPNLFGN